MYAMTPAMMKEREDMSADGTSRERSFLSPPLHSSLFFSLSHEKSCF
jgi:hypothetical protein